jgi:hypothetical protein
VRGGGARAASELEAARREMAQGEGQQEDRRLGGRGLF